MFPYAMFTCSPALKILLNKELYSSPASHARSS